MEGPSIPSLDLENQREITQALGSYRRICERVSGVNAPDQDTLQDSSLLVSHVVNTIAQIDPTLSMFTSTHHLLATLALNTGCDEPALKIFNHPITAYPTQANPSGAKQIDHSQPPSSYINTSSPYTDTIKPDMVIEYDFRLGHIYQRRGDWARARAAFERVMTHPYKDRNLHDIMLEAHKWWRLLCLLETGKGHNLPSCTPTHAKGLYQSQIAYESIAKAFDSQDAKSLANEANTHMAAYQQDGTTVVVGAVLQAFQQWQILNMRQIFSRVPISTIWDMTQSGETGEKAPSSEAVAELIQQMIDSNMLYASIEPATAGDPDVVFHEIPVDTAENAFTIEIRQRQERILLLSNEYKSVNERLSDSKEYVQHMFMEYKKELANDGQKGQLGDPDTMMDEEDLMSGVVTAS